LPEDLAYLPHVESSFNPKAFSKFGAAGIWQFTRSTGKQYMSIGYAVDERRDPIISTYAAARYLKRNHERLQNWPMAITAYNHGTSGMLRAKRARGTYEAIFKNHRSRLFKFASRNFYSEFLAARQVATNYRDYFGELDLDRPPRQTEMRLEGFVSLPDLSQALDLEIEVLHRLNPALRKPVLEGTKYIPRGYQLRLPAERERRWEALLAVQLPQLYKKAQTHSRFYTVRYGDTAGKIARKYGIRLNDLIAANRLDGRATIYVNQNLRIPHAGEQVPTQVAAVTQNTATAAGKAPTTVEKPRSKPVVIARSSPVPPLNAQPSITSPIPQSRPVPVLTAQAAVTEQAGDATITRADTRAGRPAPNRTNGPSTPLETMTVAAAAIPRSDKLPIQLVDSWQIREIPAKTAASNPEIVTGRIAVEQMIESEGRPVGIIHVEVEETLGHYAEWAGVRAQDLRRLNSLRYGRMIHIGQRLKIPLHRVDKETFEEKRYEYHKGLAEDFFSAYRVAGMQTYTIKRGDNIWTLSRENFELPLWLIQRYNTEVDLHSLLPSQKLMIPVVEENA
jgi:membrane-bound lytic murein transglycosylase D